MYTSSARAESWSALPFAARVYVAAVIALGAAAFLAYFPRSYPRPLVFVALLIAASVTSAWKVNLPISVANGSTLSVSYAANLMALLLLGPRHAVVIAMAGVWTQCAYRVKQPYPPHRTVFSVATAAVTMAATGQAYLWLGGPIAPVDFTGLARPLVSAIATYFFVNTSLIAGAIALSSSRGFLATWRDDFFWSGASFMVAGTAGAVAALVVDRGDQWEAALLVAPIYLTYRTYELFVGRLDDQRRHTEEMRQLHQETLVALTQTREAEQALADANRLKDQFLAVVSHELRTPLNAILGWAEMLRRGKLDEAARERAYRTIYDSARRQSQLIDDLLDVSRIMSGKLRLERTDVDLQTVVRDAIQVVQPTADAKRIRLVVDHDGAAERIVADPARLQQVVCNLLSNAVKFTPEDGSVAIALRRTRRAVEIHVADTGQGISPEFLPSVFEPFRQADGSTTRVHPGLGLGLSIVKNLVEAHGGTVTALSRGEGCGATFVVRLPVAAARAGSRESIVRADGADASQGVLTSLEGIRVLIVDDDAAGREVVAAHLQDSGATVLTAASAADALLLLHDQPIDVLLADIGMPGEDGYALVRRVRAASVPAISSIPAVALTAFARDEDRQLALEAGFQLHLPKPIDGGALASAIARLSRETSARREAV